MCTRQLGKVKHRLIDGIRKLMLILWRVMIWLYIFIFLNSLSIRYTYCSILKWNYTISGFCFKIFQEKRVCMLISIPEWASQEPNLWIWVLRAVWLQGFYWCKALGKGRVLPETPTLILVLCLEGRVLPLGLLWPLPKDSLFVPPVPVSLALPTSVTFYPVPGPGPHVTLPPKLSSQLSLCMNGTLEIARNVISQVSSASGGSYPRAPIHASLPLSAWTTTDQPSRLLRPPFPQVFFPKPLSHPALCPQPG